MTGLARSTYYYKPRVDPKVKMQQDADLRDRIERIQAEFPGYGYRRVYQELKRQGERQREGSGAYREGTW